MTIYNITQEPILVSNRMITSVYCYESMGYTLLFVELSEKKLNKLIKARYWGGTYAIEINETRLIDVVKYGSEFGRLPDLFISHCQRWNISDAEISYHQTDWN